MEEMREFSKVKIEKPQVEVYHREEPKVVQKKKGKVVLVRRNLTIGGAEDENVADPEPRVVVEVV
jgi:hypothetical protein